MSSSLRNDRHSCGIEYRITAFGPKKTRLLARNARTNGSYVGGRGLGAGEMFAICYRESSIGSVGWMVKHTCPHVFMYTYTYVFICDNSILIDQCAHDFDRVL